MSANLSRRGFLTGAAAVAAIIAAPPAVRAALPVEELPAAAGPLSGYRFMLMMQELADGMFRLTLNQVSDASGAASVAQLTLDDASDVVFRTFMRLLYGQMQFPVCACSSLTEIELTVSQSQAAGLLPADLIELAASETVPLAFTVESVAR